MTRLSRLGFAALSIVALSGCASAGTPEGGTDRNVLTAEEIAATRVANAYEAVERLRPRWLQIRAPRSISAQTEIVVYMNRSYLGGPEVLRQFTSSSIARLRYLDGTTAAATLSGLGGKAVEGAIIIEVS